MLQLINSSYQTFVTPKLVQTTKVFLAAAVALTLVACSSTVVPNREAGPSAEDSIQLDRFIDSIDHNLGDIWGVNELLFKPTDLVKYSDNWQTRAVINFEKGIIRFETLNPNYINALRNEIVYTLLMSEAPEDGKLYQESLPRDTTSTPFLANQVTDNYHRSIRNVGQAVAYANYLLSRAVYKRTLMNGREAYYVDLHMIAGHLQARATTFRNIVYKYAGRYNLDPKFMFAVMEVESEFNPYAKSSSGAIGLMQIISTTAGTDAFRLLGYPGRPTTKYLFNPDNNIKIGATYIYIMKTRYFAGIKNPLSQRYMMSASYNAGPGGTLRLFDTDKDRAIAKINRMTPRQVYNFLTRNHYSAEARRYLYKVTEAYKHY